MKNEKPGDVIIYQISCFKQNKHQPRCISDTLITNNYRERKISL